jgi:hypothetical protein
VKRLGPLLARAPFLAAVLSVGACVAVAQDDRFVITPPSRTEFTPVAPFLVHRCGSLDCHGQATRNLRLYGRDGLRLSPSDVPGQSPTTKTEIDDDYRSVVGLEPEVMSQVVQDHGANPERLTLIRKARGTETHKGGALVTEGDSQDVCMTSWLAGKTDQKACTAAMKSP